MSARRDGSARDRERAVAIAAVRTACRLCAAVRADVGGAGAMPKADRSPVTIADLGAQAVIALALSRHFPGEPIMAEEDVADLSSPEGRALQARALRQVEEALPGVAAPEIEAALARSGFRGGASGRFWVIDPVDGTKGFLRGGHYAVALALVENGRVELGLLGCPGLAANGDGSTGSIYVAARGQGARVVALDGDGAEQPVRVAATTDPAQARVCESVEAEHSSHGDAERILLRLGIGTPPLRMDSQAKYAAVACGLASIYLRLPTRAGYEEKVWDHAAGALLVEEAGGTVTDVNGAPLDFSAGRTLRHNRGAVATNAVLHAPTLDAVRATLAPAAR